MVSPIALRTDRGFGGSFEREQGQLAEKGRRRESLRDVGELDQSF